MELNEQHETPSEDDPYPILTLIALAHTKVRQVLRANREQ